MKLRLAIGALLGTTALATPAIAQDQDGLEAPDPDNVIIVTATRRAADVQDIPIAVTAVTPKQLAQQGIENVQGIGDVSASFNIQSSQTESQGTSIRIRGIGTTGNNIGLESAVGVFIDGVYQSRPGVALGELVDVQQVEVLRGPQGTLFGRNTTAGALVVRHKLPDLSTFEGHALATYGSFDLINVQGALSAPLVEDQLAIRFAGSYRERDGYFTSALDGSESHDRDRFLLRGTLLWEPSADVSLKIIADYQETDENCCAGVTLSASSPSTAAVNAIQFPGGAQTPGGTSLSEFPGKIRREFNSETFENDVEQWGVSAELNWDLGGAELTFIGSYRDFLGESRQADFNGGEVYSVSGVTFPAGTPPTFDDIQTTTFEARLQGDAFDGVLDWLIGAYYSDEQIAENFALGLGQDFDLIADSFGAPVGTFSGVATAGSLFLNGVFDPNDAAFGTAPFAQIGPAGQFGLNRFEQDGESFSVFTHNIFNVTDEFSVTVGARYVDDRKDGSFEQLATGGDFCRSSRAFFNAVLTDLGTNGNTDATQAAIAPFLGADTAAGLATPGAAGLSAALNCFVFAAPANDGVDPLLAGGPEEFSDTFEDDELIYTFQLAYEPNPDLLLYAGYTHGYKAGGFNLDASAAVGGADPRLILRKSTPMRSGSSRHC